MENPTYDPTCQDPAEIERRYVRRDCPRHTQGGSALEQGREAQNSAVAEISTARGTSKQHLHAAGVGPGSTAPTQITPRSRNRAEPTTSPYAQRIKTGSPSYSFRPQYSSRPQSPHTPGVDYPERASDYQRGEREFSEVLEEARTQGYFDNMSPMNAESPWEKLDIADVIQESRQYQYQQQGPPNPLVRPRQGSTPSSPEAAKSDKGKQPAKRSRR